MKKVIILLTSLTVALVSGCQDHVFEPPPSGTLQTLGAWRTGGTGPDSPNSIARGPQGNLFMTGNQEGPFVAKFTSNGVLQWRNNIKQAIDPTGNFVAADMSGNVYVAGRGIGSKADFGQSGEEVVSLASYTSEGTLRWILSTTANRGFGSLVPYAFTADEAGNTYMTGYFSGTVDFGSLQITANSQVDKIGGFEDVFLLKVNKDGAVQWVKQLGGNRADIGLGLALDQAGNVFMSGFTNTGSAGNTSFAAKYAPDGTQQWFTTVRQALTFGEGENIGVDAAGNSYVQTDAVITKLNSSGEAEWHKAIPIVDIPTFFIYSEDIVVNANGDYYITDTFSGTITIEGQTLTSSGGTDVFVAKYNKDGVFQWVFKEGGSQNEEVIKIVLGGGGIIHLLGTFEGTTTIAGTSLTSGGQTDIFVATYKE